tara:strand:+ start:2388 stop:3080 length:693 start_codon:yes stop_codon:yes gene_type:complete
MSKPDLSKIKSRIKDNTNQEPQQPEAEEKPRISAKTMEQIQSYAKDVEEMRKTEQDIQENRVELDELPENVSPTQDNVYYRGTPSDNPEVRKAIEKRCTEMDFSDLVLTGRVTQTVPIIPDKFEVGFQSLLASENYWIERNAEKEAATDWGIRSWMGYARLAMSVTEVNGKELPECASKNGIDEAAWKERFDTIMNMGEKPVEYLLVNLNWFNARVEELYRNDFDLLKNG